MKPLRSMLRFFLVTLLVTGCSGQRATHEECAEILDRLVALDMVELGFRDVELTAIKQRELRAKFSAALNDCTHMKIKPGAMECVRRVRTPKEIVERCLTE